jgi:hypothetical protein
MERQRLRHLSIASDESPPSAPSRRTKVGCIIVTDLVSTAWSGARSSAKKSKVLIRQNRKIISASQPPGMREARLESALNALPSLTKNGYCMHTKRTCYFLFCTPFTGAFPSITKSRSPPLAMYSTVSEPLTSRD